MVWVRKARGHGLWIAVWSLVGWGGTLAAPLLAEHPFVLMLMSPRALFVGLAVDSVDLLPFVLLGGLRLAATDASYFILGRRLPSGSRASARSRRLGLVGKWWGGFVRITDSLCRWLSDRGFKAGTVLFFRPNGKYLAVAGAYGVSAWVAGLSSVIGTCVYLAAFHLGLGLFF